ncbi:MAG: hypothetical protein HY225_02975 [Candidatus Vogelbacteria bacterium]|nr:hypothetical protein [Candidatus Vogelbacteria bacterium]
MALGPSEETVREQVENEIEEQAKHCAEDANRRWEEIDDLESRGTVVNIGFCVVNQRKFMVLPIAEKTMRLLTKLGYKCKKDGKVTRQRNQNENQSGYILGISAEKRKEDDMRLPEPENQITQEKKEIDIKVVAPNSPDKLKAIDKLRDRYNRAVRDDEEKVRAHEEKLKETAKWNLEQIIEDAEMAVDEKRTFVEYDFSLVTGREDFDKIISYLAELLVNEGFYVQKLGDILQNVPRQGELSQTIEISGWAPKK